MITPAVPLNAGTLAHHAARVRVPRYDRARLVPAVVHLSVGSFHRSHQAVYFDDLAASGETGWGITGVGLRRPEMRAALLPQDGLYTLVTRAPGGDEGRVIGSITRYLFAPEESAAVLGALVDPRTRLVTLTITGDGYRADPDDDAALRTPGGVPASAVGLLVEALDRRRRAGTPPFTVLSCDNIPGNGRIARRALERHAERRSPALAAFVAREVAFPSSMVDRITPRTSEDDRRAVARRFGIADRWPVVTEPYSEWVVEDGFCAGRPPLAEVGVRFVPDVEPYALMKTRLLNASHCALGHLGVLAGLGTTREAMCDPVLAAAVERMMEVEVSPLLPAVPGVDLPGYRRSVLTRLENPRMTDSLFRLCRSGSTKIPTHVLSSVAEARRRGTPHALLLLAVAGWCAYLGGTDEAGAPIVVDDPRAPLLTGLARLGGGDPRPLVVGSGVFGPLAEDAGFVGDLTAAVSALRGGGVRAALAEALSERALTAA